MPPFAAHPLADTSPEAVRHWQSLLDARLIGTRPETPPDVAATRAATDALFRAIARDRHRLARTASALPSRQPPPPPVRPEPVEGRVTSDALAATHFDRLSANGEDTHASTAQRQTEGHPA